MPPIPNSECYLGVQYGKSSKMITECSFIEHQRDECPKEEIFERENAEVIRDNVQSHSTNKHVEKCTESSVFASESITLSASAFKHANESSSSLKRYEQHISTCAIPNEDMSVTNQSPSVACKLEAASSTLDQSGQIDQPPTEKSPTKHKKRKRSIDYIEKVQSTTNNDATECFNDNGTMLTVSTQTGRWTATEHRAFIRGLSIYGREWKRVALDIPTRTSAQVRSHAQKYFTKIDKQLQQLQEKQNQCIRRANTVDHRPMVVNTSDISAISKSKEMSNDENMNDSTSVIDAGDHSIGTAGTFETVGSPMSPRGLFMSDSVRHEAARILANPTTVEHEVRETLIRLRNRYHQLKERYSQVMQHQQQDVYTRHVNDNKVEGPGIDSINTTSDIAIIDDSPSSLRAMVQEDDEIIALHVLQGLQQSSLSSSNRNNAVVKEK